MTPKSKRSTTEVMTAVLRNLKQWSPAVLVTLASATSVYWGSIGDPWGTGLWVFFLFLGLLLSALIAQISQRPTYNELAESNLYYKGEHEKMSAGIEQSIQVLIRKLANFSDRASNEDRISVYYCHDGVFIMLSRYSLQPLHGHAGRRVYPIDQGVIGKAWIKGAARKELSADPDTWLRQQVEMGYDEEQANNLTMRSRSIAAQRIEVDGNAVGVLVLESMLRGRMSPAVLKSLSDTELYEALGELVEANALMTPRGQEISIPPSVRGQKQIDKWKVSSSQAIGLSQPH